MFTYEVIVVDDGSQDQTSQVSVCASRTAGRWETWSRSGRAAYFRLLGEPKAVLVTFCPTFTSVVHKMPCAKKERCRKGFITAGKSQRPELESAGHMTSTVGGQRETSAPTLPACLLTFCSHAVFGTTHSGLGLPLSVNTQDSPPRKCQWPSCLRRYELPWWCLRPSEKTPSRCDLWNLSYCSSFSLY